MSVMTEKIHQMRILISIKELADFKKEFPNFNWTAGDTTIRWNANDPDEVNLARMAFEAYKKKHPKTQAFSVDVNGNKGAKELSGFDPNAEMILVQDWMQKG